MKLKLMKGMAVAIALWVIPSITAKESAFIDLGRLNLEVRGDMNPFVMSHEIMEPEPGLMIVELELKAEDSARPPRFELLWEIPSVEAYGTWRPGITFHKAIWPIWTQDNRFYSSINHDAPVFTYYRFDDTNLMTFACSDVFNTIKIGSGVKEETANLESEMLFFEHSTEELSHYSVKLLFDFRRIHFSESLQNVALWWEGMKGLEPVPIPEHAKSPMYSTWYSFHQSLVAEELYTQCELSKALGCEAIIIDDGWQTLDSKRGYDYVGDWKPERLPKMAEMVERIHEIGMKVMLWYSLPFIGKKSENYERFQGYYLREGEHWPPPVLDPRYPEIREFLIGMLKDAMVEWKLDGFKLDFIDEIRIDVDSDLENNRPGRDIASVNEAIYTLMSDIVDELSSINPDVLIEFRQSYNGPGMRRFGNMFRAGDCPNAINGNRVRTVDIRLLAGDTATHSDMMMWHPDEPVEHAALQLLNIMHSVPQISVKLDEIPEDHVEMLDFYTHYWVENRSILLEGSFKPHKPTANFPIIETADAQKSIFLVYEDMAVDLTDLQTSELDIINGKTSEFILVETGLETELSTYEVYTCTGELASQGTLGKEAIEKISVPASGIIVFDPAKSVNHGE